MTTQNLRSLEIKIDSADEQQKLFIASNLVATDFDVAHIESALDVRLPKSYRWFLETYGAGGVNGVFIEGMGAPGHRYAVIEETFDFRNDHGTALSSWVFLEYFGDDWLCLLDTGRNNEKREDCPVIVYQVGENRWEEGWPTFSGYLEERFFGAQECLETENE